MTEELGKGEEEQARKRSRVCECGRDAVEKVVGPRSANRGLRYLCCDHFVFFGKKKDYCRFFEWIDQPRVSKEQKREAQALSYKEKGAAPGNRALLQPAIRTRNAVRDLEKQCKTIEGLHVNKENFELEMRVSDDDPLRTQAHKNVENGIMDIPIASQHGLIACDGAHVIMENVSAAAQMTCNDGFLLAEYLQSSPTNAVQTKTGTRELNTTLHQNKAVVEDVHDLNLSADDTLKGADTSISQMGPGFSEVPKDKDTNQEGKQSLENASEFWETPTCLCLRAAVLKTVKSKGPNKGLRFWVCSNSQPFYVKKKNSKLNAGEDSCKFFRWVDTPFEMSDTQKNEEKQRRKETRKRKELSLIS